MCKKTKDLDNFNDELLQVIKKLLIFIIPYPADSMCIIKFSKLSESNLNYMEQKTVLGFFDILNSLRDI